jgi:hypothetical protein
MNTENADLEAALDGLIAATNYAEAIDEDDLAVEIGRLYQRVGQAAPDEHWDGPEDVLSDEFLEALEKSREQRERGETVSAAEARERLGLEDSDPDVCPVCGNEYTATITAPKSKLTLNATEAPTCFDTTEEGLRCFYHSQENKPDMSMPGSDGSDTE